MRKFSTVQNAGFSNILSFHIIRLIDVDVEFLCFSPLILATLDYILLLCNRSENVRKAA